jgi:NAD(P)-dependent dehydrogenase (short-subunit alcohol dehydrogenase family)
MKKVWFITGSSRGLGRNLTEAVLESGEQVAATARKPEELNDLIEKYKDQILPLKLDVTDNAEISKAILGTIDHFGRIDVLVNNAGFGVTGVTEAFTEEQVQSQLETNLYAPIAITRAVLPYMRKQRSGRILQISSIGGRIGNPGLSIYMAAKFGLSGFSEALAKEVAPLGIYITSVEPGGFRTDWGGASMTYAGHVEGYDKTVDSMIDYIKNHYTPLGDPEKAAKVMIELAAEPNPPVHLILGSESAGMLKQYFADRQEEYDKWLPVTLSTDHKDAPEIFKFHDGQSFDSK